MDAALMVSVPSLLLRWEHGFSSQHFCFQVWVSVLGLALVLLSLPLNASLAGQLDNSSGRGRLAGSAAGRGGSHLCFCGSSRKRVSGICVYEGGSSEGHRADGCCLHPHK